MTALATEYKDDDKVSTMKGQLVEVGDRNKYHYNAPKFHLDVNPFGLMAGVYSLGASYALTDLANIRADLSYNEEDSSFEYSRWAVRYVWQDVFWSFSRTGPGPSRG